jgi:hypothetical protein
MGSFLARVAGLGANPPKTADKLDGLNWSAFVVGGANVRTTIMDVASSTTELSDLLDWLRFQYQCPASETDPGSLSFRSSLAAMTYFIDNGSTNPTVGTRLVNVFGGFVSASDPPTCSRSR